MLYCIVSQLILAPVQILLKGLCHKILTCYCKVFFHLIPTYNNPTKISILLSYSSVTFDISLVHVHYLVHVYFFVHHVYVTAESIC
jgi:hypothetical protein